MFKETPIVADLVTTRLDMRVVTTGNEVDSQ